MLVEHRGNQKKGSEIMGEAKQNSINRRGFLASGAYVLAASAVAANLVPVSASATSLQSLPKEPGAGDWPRYGCDIRNTRFNPSERTIGKSNVDRLKVKWKFDIDVPIETTPTVIGDTLFFGAPGAYYALDSRTGQLKWKYEMPERASGGIRRGVQYYNGRVYSADQAGWVRCLDAATGQQVWERDFSKDPEPEGKRGIGISGACLAFDEKIYLGTTGNKNRVICLNADNGTTAWQYWITGEHDIGKGGSMWTSPALDEEERVLYMVTGSNKLPGSRDPSLFTESVLAFDADTGYLRWFYQAHPNDPHDLDWSAHPVIFDATAPPMKRGAIRQCIAAGNKVGYYCFNRYTGELYWRVQLTQRYHYGGPNVDEIAFHDNKVYTVSNAATQLIGKPPLSVTAALDAYTGRIVWWTYNMEGIIQGAIGGANGVLYQGFNNGRMEGLDADTGKVLWEYTLPSSRRGGFAIANGALYCSNGSPGALQLGGAAGINPPELVRAFRNLGTYSVYCFTIDGR